MARIKGVSTRALVLRLLLFFSVGAPLAVGQVGNATITGTVTDPAGAAVAGARVEAKNAQTGVIFSSISTTSGNYTITDLPAGSYTIAATVRGFKTYSHTNLLLAAARTLREDLVVEPGVSTESVTVTAEATLLNTGAGDLTHNVTIDQLDQLPLLGIGTVNAGASGYRNPFASLLTLPGVSNYASSTQFTLNGLGGTLTETMRVEGQDSTSRLFGTFDYTQITQPGADSIQEIAYQTSNYAPEFGQAGSVVINMTMKSGTNQYHGSGYDYFVNEDLNAGGPYSQSSSGGKLRPRNRRNDFGGTLGGPIYVPKVYNGHNKSFFFFSYEQFLESLLYADSDTVATTPYLKGDFSAISPNGNCSLCGISGIPATPLGSPVVQLDPLGNKMYANEIYDPSTRGVTATNLGYAYPFMNNQIPVSRFDPVTVKLNALIASLGVKPSNSNLTGNYAASVLGGRYSVIPSVKIDHNIDHAGKLSFYYSENNTQSQVSASSQDGLPPEIGAYRGNFITTYTERLNYDRTLTPTLLLHAGAGYLHTSFGDHAPFLNFDETQFGVTGMIQQRQFPSFTGMLSQYGGMQAIGTQAQIQSTNYQERPSMTANATWVHRTHTYKAGAELYLEGIISGTFSGMTFATGTGPTSEPFTPAGSLNGFSTGFGYASWLLGDYNLINQTPHLDPREGYQTWALFAQDSWKVTRKLTVDYGLRWDLSTPEHEQYGRLGQFDPTVANPNAGGHLGGYRYASTCTCSFYKPAYPYAIGPRLGVAYEINPKTVFRAGWGVTYQFVQNPSGATVGSVGLYNLSANSPSYVPPAYQFVNIETPGAVVAPTWPVTTQVYPPTNSVSNAFLPDKNALRPPRINQFSIGFQRELTRSFVIEASYVGNRAVWVTGGPLGQFSQISAQQYANYGLYPYPGTGPCQVGAAGVGTLCKSTAYNNDADRAILTQSISTSTVIQRQKALGIANVLPYTGYPTSQSLGNSLYAYPQFGNLEPNSSPTGNSKYDSLQIKATKRLSHNLQAGGAFTWGEGFTRPARQDFFNPNGDVWQLQQIPPRALNFQFIYTTSNASLFPKFLNLITKGWQLGGFANYQSGAFLPPPLSNQFQEFLPSEDIRVPGQPLYAKGVDINDHSTFNPYVTQVLNPAAWKSCPVNTVCPAAAGTGFNTVPVVYYKDFRAPRTPTENANIGRIFRIKERMNLFIRAEFVNVFNRTLLPAPSTANPQNAALKNSFGIQTSGFGVISTYLAPNTAYAPPTQATSAVMQGRTGTLIARFSF